MGYGEKIELDRKFIIMLQSVVRRSGAVSRLDMRPIFFFIFLTFFSGTVNGAERGPFVVDCERNGCPQLHARL